MSISIIKYTSSFENDWDEFIQNSVNGNFLHKRSFYNSNPKNHLDDYSFLFFKNQKPIAVIPGILTNINSLLTYSSHLRSTYGGFIVNESVGIVEALEIVELFLTELSKLQVKEVIVRNPFRIFYQRISDEIEYSLWYHGFEVSSREAEVYIDLQMPLDQVRKRYDNGTKYNVKKANKLIQTRIAGTQELSEFWNILEENLLAKHGKKPVHSYTQMLRLMENTENNILFFAAYFNNQLVGGSIVFKINSTALHAQYIGQDINYQEYRPINSLLDSIIEYGHKNNFRFFNLGTANEGGKVVNTGLFHFKESFGGRSVLRETHSKKLI